MEDGSDRTPQTAASADALDEAEARREEVDDILERGPRSANRSGALAFLAFAVTAAALAHFFLSAGSGAAYLQRLDAELVNHAELSLAAMGGDAPMAVAPAWPIRLYENLRRDILVYCALAALAAYLWSLAARARARRDAFLVHDKLAAELAELRARLDGGPPATDRKG